MTFFFLLFDSKFRCKSADMPCWLNIFFRDFKWISLFFFASHPSRSCGRSPEEEEEEDVEQGSGAGRQSRRSRHHGGRRHPEPHRQRSPPCHFLLLPRLSSFHLALEHIVLQMSNTFAFFKKNKKIYLPSGFWIASWNRFFLSCFSSSSWGEFHKTYIVIQYFHIVM